MQVWVQDNFFSSIFFAAICVYPKSAGYSTSFCQQQVTGRYECLGWRIELKADYFRVCLREVKTFDGKHQNLKVASLTRIVIVHRNICRNTLVLLIAWFSLDKFWSKRIQEVLAGLWDKCVRVFKLLLLWIRALFAFERLFSAELYKKNAIQLLGLAGIYTKRCSTYIWRKIVAWKWRSSSGTRQFRLL